MRILIADDDDRVRRAVIGMISSETVRTKLCCGREIPFRELALRHRASWAAESTTFMRILIADDDDRVRRAVIGMISSETVRTKLCCGDGRFRSESSRCGIELHRRQNQRPLCAS